MIGDTIGNDLDKYIEKNIKSILDNNKFPDYDNIYTDSFSDLIDKLCIVHIRYWYLEDAMSNCKNDEELVILRKKSEHLFKEKRPMLVEAIDKFVYLLVTNKINFTPINVKHYSGWKQNK